MKPITESPPNSSLVVYDQTALTTQSLDLSDFPSEDEPLVPEEVAPQLALDDMEMVASLRQTLKRASLFQCLLNPSLLSVRSNAKEQLRLISARQTREAASARQWEKFNQRLIRTEAAYEPFSPPTEDWFVSVLSGVRPKGKMDCCTTTAGRRDFEFIRPLLPQALEDLKEAQRSKLFDTILVATPYFQDFTMGEHRTRASIPPALLGELILFGCIYGPSGKYLHAVSLPAGSRLISLCKTEYRDKAGPIFRTFPDSRFFLIHARDSGYHDGTLSLGT